MCVMTILKVAYTQDFIASLKDRVWEKPQGGGGQIDLPALRVRDKPVRIKAILLISSAQALCLLSLNLCCVVHINLLFFMNSL